jgi:hypothetical protein
VMALCSNLPYPRRIYASLVSGKTYFLLFVLLSRLSEGLPTVVQYNHSTLPTRVQRSLDTNLHHDFEDNRSKCYGGSADYDGNDCFDLPSGTWALPDSNIGPSREAWQMSLSSKQHRLKSLAIRSGEKGSENICEGVRPSHLLLR